MRDLACLAWVMIAIAALLVIAALVGWICHILRRHRSLRRRVGELQAEVAALRGGRNDAIRNLEIRRG